MIRTALTISALALCAAPAVAQDSEEGRGSDQGSASETLGASTDGFLPTEGETIYRIACAGCHQPQGTGAVGAAQYPPLSNNPRLRGGRYPAWIVLNGMGAMPSFADWLSDAQVQAVVGYIQQSFGNDYETGLTEEMIAGLRDAPEP